jgi:hypothetical protein
MTSDVGGLRGPFDTGEILFAFIVLSSCAMHHEYNLLKLDVIHLLCVDPK